MKKANSHSIRLVESLYCNTADLIVVRTLIAFFHIGCEFGAYMQVLIQNDGPVTIDLETPHLPPPKQVLVLCS